MKFKIDNFVTRTGSELANAKRKLVPGRARRVGPLVASLAGALLCSQASAAVITFDSFTGGSSFSFDGDGDTIADVLFSTVDPGGFNPFGPGLGQPHIDEPGIEGGIDSTPDLDITFFHGAANAISFGFAVQDPTTDVRVRVFDSGNIVLADQTFVSGNVGASFEGGLPSISFSGVASRAEIDFVGPAIGSRYIIDNFTGTFGSSESIPEPSAALLALSALGLCLRRRR